MVIYPRYQQDIFTKSDDFTPNAIKAVKEGIIILNTGDHVKPDTSKFAIARNSLGGIGKHKYGSGSQTGKIYQNQKLYSALNLSVKEIILNNNP